MPRYADYSEQYAMSEGDFSVPHVFASPARSSSSIASAASATPTASAAQRWHRAARLTVCAFALMTTVLGAQAQTRKVVRTEADLPRYTYKVDRAPSALLQADDATFARFAAPVRADLEKTLADYDIQDHATLRGLLSTELLLQLLAGNDDAALDTVHKIRALEDKPDAKLTSGLRVEAWLQTEQAHGDIAHDFVQRYAALIDPLPWKVVGNTIKEAKESDEFVSADLILGGVQTDLDPGAAKSHELGNAAAWQLIRARARLKVLLPLQQAGHDVLAAYVAQHDRPLPDIWAAREVTLSASDALTPVRIGIWDSGVDPALFPHNIYTDPHPGKYDAHGLAFDLDGYLTHGPLFPLPPAAKAGYNDEINLMKGFSDLESNIDSPEATEVKHKLRGLKPAEVPGFLQTLEMDSNFVHGTHVAGIAVRGTPAAQLVIARLTYDWKNIPTPPTEANTRRGVADYRAYIAYFKQHNVRVVNMSWGGDAQDDEVALEKNGIGKNAAERKKLAQHYFDIDKAGLYAALKSAPDILFICAAGNSDSSADFDDSIPASFNLPNLLTVGAVDQAGNEASFTSYGKTVRVDADGFQVLSYVPGGRKVKLSGTSMASPNVTNLAAKLLALDPKLTPEQVIGLISDSATASSDGRRHLIDPVAAVALLKQRYGAT